MLGLLQHLEKRLSDSLKKSNLVEKGDRVMPQQLQLDFGEALIQRCADGFG